jgi:hypothetical protein
MSTSQSKTMSASDEINTLLELRKIFHTELMMMTLHLRNTREKMMNMLNTRKKKKKNEWTAEYILKLATDNKIKWVQGSDDPIPYDTYKKGMNDRLAEILHG